MNQAVEVDPQGLASFAEAVWEDARGTGRTTELLVRVNATRKAVPASLVYVHAHTMTYAQQLRQAYAMKYGEDDRIVFTSGKGNVFSRDTFEFYDHYLAELQLREALGVYNRRVNYVH